MRSWYPLPTLLLALVALLVGTAGAAAAAESNDGLVLMVTGSVEHYAYLADEQFGGSQRQLLDLAGRDSNGGAKGGPTFLRLTGAVLCVNKSGDWVRSEPVKNTAQKVELHVGRVSPSHSYVASTAMVLAEGVFLIPEFKKPADQNNTELYLQITHNCTTAGETTTERFNVSTFAEHPLKRFASLSQGYFFLPVASHDTAFNRALTKTLAFAKYFSRQQRFVPQALFVKARTYSLGQEPGVVVWGRIYNWDVESMPEPVGTGQRVDEAFINSTRVPLHFAGRVQVGVEGQASCSEPKLALYRDGKEIMSGTAHGTDGKFEMSAENGGLVELMAPLPDWRLVVEYGGCNGGAVRSQKFAFTNSVKLDGDYLKAARLEPVS